MQRWLNRYSSESPVFLCLSIAFCLWPSLASSPWRILEWRENVHYHSALLESAKQWSSSVKKIHRYSHVGGLRIQPSRTSSSYRIISLISEESRAYCFDHDVKLAVLNQIASLVIDFLQKGVGLFPHDSRSSDYVPRQMCLFASRLDNRRRQ